MIKGTGWEKGKSVYIDFSYVPNKVCIEIDMGKTSRDFGRIELTEKQLKRMIVELMSLRTEFKERKRRER